ncbi:50S ribosomal protein L25/general stress protein Ctc [Curvivirga sp.]|uniref:50S ribosomal protein L25/general stress protein Ctc n=1 Tax=Curvivirga sp. TaxID=2856848 RepID=UPI003B5C2702
MSDISVIPAVKRERAGKGAARAIRREGLVPCVIYGDNKDPSMVSVDPRVIWKGLESGHFFSTVYTVDVEGGSKEKALVRDVQFHPVSDQVLHVDFVRAGKNTTLHVSVPVVFLNEDSCEGVKAGGIISYVRHEVEVICAATDVPSEFTLDLATAQVGDTIRISDIDMPKGVTSAITDRDPVVVNIAAPKGAASADDAEEEGEAEEAASEE